MADWKADLGDLFKAQAENNTAEQDQLAETRRAATEWFKEVAVPAYEELKVELEKHGRRVGVNSSSVSASIEVEHDGALELRHSIEVLLSPGRAFIKLRGRQIDQSDGKPFGWEGQVTASSGDGVIERITKEDLISKFMSDYSSVIRRR